MQKCSSSGSDWTLGCSACILNHITTMLSILRCIYNELEDVPEDEIAIFALLTPLSGQNSLTSHPLLRMS